jgi:tetratricopeptide (TPR) repeat protein
MRKIFAIIFLASTSLSAGIAANPVEFDRANQQYDQGNFEEARKLYESLVNARNFSSNLFYNLGNAAYRLEDRGAAMLAYERALALEPSHPEALSNLEFLRNQTGAKIARQSWIEHLFLPFDVSTYAWIAAAAAWIALSCIAAMAFSRRSAKNRLWTITICSAFVFTYAAGAVSYAEKQRALAVVISPQSEARFAPADSAALQGTLPAGSRVRVLADRGPWIYCMLPDESRAWIQAKSVKRIRLSST